MNGQSEYGVGENILEIAYQRNRVTATSPGQMVRNYSLKTNPKEDIDIYNQKEGTKQCKSTEKAKPEIKNLQSTPDI